MVLGYFEPGYVIDWETLDTVTAKAPGLWTWPMAGLLWLKKRGYDVCNIEVFDYDSFASKGKDYLAQVYGQEVAESQARHSRIEDEQDRARLFSQLIATEQRIPSYVDVKKLLDQGFLIIVNINACALEEQTGYSGHIVLITAYDAEGLVLQDPGLPPHPERRVAYTVFEKAWAYPNQSAKNLVALRLQK